MNLKIPLILFCFYVSLTVQTASAFVPQTKIEALFLYKFIQNTNWPGNKSKIVVGFLGESAVQAELEDMLSSRSNANITIRKIDLSGVAVCDVVFLPESQNSKFNSLIESVKDNSILIITEDNGLIRKGAGISFTREGATMSFIVNKSSLDRRKLQVSGSLLSLGKTI